MKKFILDHMRLIIIIICIILAIAIICILFNVTVHKKNHPSSTEYKVSDKVVELPGTEVITTDSMKEEHCLNDICVSDVVVYNANKEGRVECIVTNKSNKVKTDYFKLVFNDIPLVISYKNLKPSKTVKAIAQYKGKDIKNVDDYVLKELTKEEKEKIKK